MLRPLLTLGACAALFACQADGHAPARHIPPGSSVELHQALTFPPERGSIQFQDGRLQSGVDHYRPHCKFVIGARAADRTVQPDRFEVRRVQRFIEGALAALPTVKVSLFDNGGPSDTPYITTLYLHSPRQPEVVRLSCQSWQDPSQRDSGHLTVPEIQAALGSVFTLRLAE